MKLLITAFALSIGLCFSAVQTADATVATHTVQAFALFGEPKYGPNFQHFDYVNPDAPKGGTVHLVGIGTYDSFNPFIVRGVQGGTFDGSSGSVYDQLMTMSGDEAATCYGVLAESLTYADDYSWVEFNLRPAARWHDGTPITAEDVVFTVETFQKSGSPNAQSFVANIAKAEAKGPRRVRFTLKQGDRVALLGLAQMAIVPKHFWQGKDFSAPIVTPPLASGPYKVASFDLGRRVVFERVKDYWAKDLPVMRGRYNFDKVIVDYYRDQNVALEAFKAGQVDIRNSERSAQIRAQGYDFPAAKQGLVKLSVLGYDSNGPLVAYFFNLRKPKFQDARVREALAYAYDFAWINKNLAYGQLGRPESYFLSKDFQAAGHGLPSTAELSLLEPYRNRIPARVFTQPVMLPDTDGTQDGLRKNLQIAAQLLKAAGYSNKGGRLVNDKTGEPFSFEILLIVGFGTQGFSENWIANLKLLGIDASLRQVDATQFQQRLDSRDFDVEEFWWFQPPPGVPSGEQRDRFGSAAADIRASANWSGIKNSAVDALVEKVIEARDKDSYIAALHALDRVLMWNFYTLPALDGTAGKLFVGYWDRFGRPKIEPTRMPPLAEYNVWWVDPAKDAKLIAARGTTP